MKPIIFNTEMVKAILESRKTSFRLPIKLKDNSLICTGYIFSSTDRKRNDCYSFGKNKECDMEYVKPKYKVDDILYVKETFQTCECGFCEICQVLDGIVFKADYNNKGEHPDLYSCHEDETYWKPSIHLKQKDARIFLKVINVRVERLQDISEDDLEKEGIVSYSEKWENMKCECTKNNRCQRYCDRRLDFINLWNSTLNFHNGIRKSQNILNKYNWEDNPYVFVYEFVRIEK